MAIRFAIPSKSSINTVCGFAPSGQFYLALAVGKCFGATLKTQRRTYYTSHAGTHGSVPNITTAIDDGSKMPGDKQNFVMLADVGTPSNTPEYLQRSENRMLALEALKIPNERTTYIASADKLLSPDQRKAFKNFLKFQVMTRGHFQHVLVVRGSDMQMKKKLGTTYESEISDAYAAACAIVHETHANRLALIMNLHQPYVSLMAEQAMKKRFMAVKYFTSPIFRLTDLPIETLKHLEEEMQRGENELTFGLLEASTRMYGSTSQQIVTPQDHRVNDQSGRDRYYLPPLGKDGKVDLSYISDVLAWGSRYHRKPAEAFYTRSGVGHNAQLILEAMRSTEFDLTYKGARQWLDKRKELAPEGKSSK